VGITGCWFFWDTPRAAHDHHKHQPKPLPLDLLVGPHRRYVCLRFQQRYFRLGARSSPSERDPPPSIANKLPRPPCSRACGSSRRASPARYEKDSAAQTPRAHYSVSSLDGQQSDSPPLPAFYAGCLAITPHYPSTPPPPIDRCRFEEPIGKSAPQQKGARARSRAKREPFELHRAAPASLSLLNKGKHSFSTWAFSWPVSRQDESANQLGGSASGLEAHGSTA